MERDKFQTLAYNRLLIEIKKQDEHVEKLKDAIEEKLFKVNKIYDTK